MLWVVIDTAFATILTQKHHVSLSHPQRELRRHGLQMGASNISTFASKHFANVSLSSLVFVDYSNVHRQGRPKRFDRGEGKMVSAVKRSRKSADPPCHMVAVVQSHKRELDGYIRCFMRCRSLDVELNRTRFDVDVTNSSAPL